jgi:hypothetical protein
MSVNDLHKDSLKFDFFQEFRYLTDTQLVQPTTVCFGDKYSAGFFNQIELL